MSFLGKKERDSRDSRGFLWIPLDSRGFHRILVDSLWIPLASSPYLPFSLLFRAGETINGRQRRGKATHITSRDEPRRVRIRIPRDTAGFLWIPCGFRWLAVFTYLFLHFFRAAEAKNERQQRGRTTCSRRDKSQRVGDQGFPEVLWIPLANWQ